MNQPSKGYMAGILGASCCVLPLILVAVGLGGSLLTVFLVKYKAYLMAVAIFAVAYAWYAYRRDAKICESDICQDAGGLMRKKILWANTIVVAFFFVVTYTPVGAMVGVDVDNKLAMAAGTAGVTRSQKLALRVEGMT